MHAWCINNEQLQLDSLPAPQPGPEEIRVTVKAVGVNRADLLQVKGRYPAPPGTRSDIPGLEYAGVINAVGERVQHRQVGEAVMGLVPGCAYAEQLVSHEREALTVPAGMSFPQAVTVPEAFLTAYRALFLEAQLQPGQWCLIRPASAAVGLAATQLAATLGARPIGSSRTPSKLDAAFAAGLAASVQDDATLTAQLDHLTGSAGLAVVLDMVGPEWAPILAALRAEGTLLSIGVLGGLNTELNLGSLLMKRLTLKAMTMRSQPLENRIDMARLYQDRLAPLFDSGRLQPLPFERFAFDQAPAAHHHMASHDFSGKRVLVLNGE